MNLYKNPKYYEIAFSFRNIPKEVNFFESAIKKFSKIKVKKVFELASGNSPYLEEWNRRGYQYYGLDLNPEMIDFTKKKAEEKNIKAKLFQGNMNNFSLSRLKVDLTYVLLGSFYPLSNQEFFKHLDCVSRILKKDGLYILDGVVWFNLSENNKQSWTISKNGIKVKTTYYAEIVDSVKQTFKDRIILDIDDNKTKKKIHNTELRKFFFPQEFLSLVKCHNKFEFMGWFNDFDINEPASSKGRQAVVLRKIRTQ